MWRLKTLPDSRSLRSRNGTTGRETVIDTSEYFCGVDREARRASRAFLPWTRAGSATLPAASGGPGTSLDQGILDQEREMIEAGLARARGRVSGSSGPAAKLASGDGIRNQSPRGRGKSNSRRRERSPRCHIPALSAEISGIPEDS
jgi:hypothetical protein